MKRFQVALVILSLSPLCVRAQMRRSIQAVGTASISAQPDQVKVDIGVTTMANTAQDASAQNATQMSAVLNQIRQVLGPAADIKTIAYSITPVYRNPQGEPPVLVGYTATNTVEVTSGDKDSIVKVIDSVSAVGASNITGLRFALSNDEPVKQQALTAASKQALAHAQAIASGLGAKLGAIIAALEGYSVTPLTGDRGPTAAAPPTPIETGLVQVTATVTVQAEIAQ